MTLEHALEILDRHCTDQLFSVRTAWDFMRRLLSQYEAGLVQATEAVYAANAPVAVDDVVQLVNGAGGFGPMLCIVDEVRAWGIVCHWEVCLERGTPPNWYPTRAKTGEFVRIGRAAFPPIRERPNDTEAV